MTDDSIVVVGRVGAAYGIKGWLHVQSFTDPADNLTTFDHLLMRKQSGDWQGLTHTEFQKHQSGWIMKPNNIVTRTEAETYVNFELGIERSALPALEADEHYWIDLIGLNVINTEQVNLGNVQEILETGGPSVMKVLNNDTQYLIPLVKPVLVKIAKESHITVNWEADWDA